MGKAISLSNHIYDYKCAVTHILRVKSDGGSSVAKTGKKLGARSMGSSSWSGWLALPALGAAIFGITTYVIPSWSNEVVIYTAFCPTTPVREHCAQDEEWSGRTTYKANFEGQFVLYWVDGSEINKYSKCAVLDRLNWSYEAGMRPDNVPIKMVMQDGKFTDGYGGIGPNFYNVSAIDWYTL